MKSVEPKSGGKYFKKHKTFCINIWSQVPQMIMMTKLNTLHCKMTVSSPAVEPGLLIARVNLKVSVCNWLHDELGKLQNVVYGGNNQMQVNDKMSHGWTLGIQRVERRKAHIDCCANKQSLLTISSFVVEIQKIFCPCTSYAQNQ